ncbi:hypothetical protein GOB93_07755 [Acetobacter musti]|uniref:HipA-like kinase domain-containing protein n=1 Tax=Acetobacter musti TaxID=864732 RepID=A0ABX0JP41_9PROT|nr:HipA family kinase [Acetobacter musti]NHN84538.1 hypothetical protein [Acetobacter musti]
MDPVHKLEEGVEGGFWVKDPPLSGYAKPRKLERLHVNSPIAATEKIASDLAYELDLPVPPVTLFSRESYPKTEMGQHAVSLPPFSEVLTWKQICANPVLNGIARSCSQGAMSAILPFDTWLHCHDHYDHGGNLLVSILNEKTCNFAFIDYSWSLAFSWKLANYKENYVAPCYDPATTPDLKVLESTIQAIETLDDAKIDQIVSRIPGDFLTLEDRQLILDGLMYRKQNLRSIIGSCYAEVV